MNGASVPRPSVAFVPSKNTVPGYNNSASRVRRLGEAFTRGMPVSSNHMLRV